MKEVKEVSFAELKFGDKFRVLNDGWSKTVWLYNEQRSAPKNDRLVFHAANVHGTISIPGAVIWKLRLEIINNI